VSLSHTLFPFPQLAAPAARRSVAAAAAPACGPGADPARRVVVTGMGVVSCLGHDPDTFYNALLAGQSGIRAIEGWDTTDFTTTFAGQIRDFDPGVYIDKKNARRMDDVIKVRERVCVVVCDGLLFERTCFF
jgi:3-oxoacyl-[acyl-carrier-protein] synthase II